MTDLTDYLENKLLDHATGRAAYTKPPATYLALFTGNPSEAGGGVEATGSGYARKPVTWSVASGGVTSNTSIVSFTPAGGNYGTISAIGLFDAEAGGNLLLHKNVNDFATYQDVTVQFAIGAITFALD
jgi:hypothetical protein